MATTFLILSDTHDDAFPNPATMPKVDVVLHCGDLTMIGGLGNYKKAIANLQAIDARLKLVIAGNHDVSLDPKWWQANLDDDDDPDEPAKARALFKAEETNGLYLLDEGTYSFTLPGNRRFTVYASPYTPEFNGYAWSYEAGENRFSGKGAENPIPSGGVDIVMTHGPPLPPSDNGVDYKLDVNRDGTHCGCPVLFEAIRRAKPKLHCFGHLHEGYGAQEILWTGAAQGALKPMPYEAQPLVSETGKTLLVNAAMMSHGGGGHNRPWMVSLDLLHQEQALSF